MKKILILTFFWFSLLQAVSIFEIQYTTDAGDGTYPSNYEGQTVTTGGIVTGTDFSNGRFFIGSSSGGAWSGLYIYNNDYNVAIGDSVLVTGEVYEYYGFTEISPAISVEVVSSGNPLPPYTVVSSWEAQNEELYESVLVQLDEIIVTQEYDDWSEWDVDDGSGNCIISTGFFNMEDSDLPIIMDYPFSFVSGIVSYTWGEFQMNPRSLSDIQSMENNFIISIPEQYIYTSGEIEIPIDLTFYGDDQQIQNYQFSLEYNSSVLEYSNYIATNTLSDDGSIIVEQPIEGVIEIDYEGEFVFSEMELLLKLNFTGLSSGTADLNFSNFELDGSSVVFFSIGQIIIQTEATPIGDTLTVIQRPLLNVPEIVMPGEEFVIECLADAATSNWFAQLQFKGNILPLPIEESVYNSDIGRWLLTVFTPEPDLFELYDLTVGASNLETDTTVDAVKIIPEYKSSYSFIHITDTHLPSHIYYGEPGAATDTTEVEDLREVIRDINLINPEFVLLTGDFVNEGELEDFENRRVYTKAQKMLTEFEVPVYLVAGNHDIGGWYDTPPPQGTARREWWRFFGWKWLQDPPDADPYYTQNYSFDYGSEHFTGMEAYENYDDYLHNIYGDVSFTSGQMQWLNFDLENSESENNIVFYHMDFDDEIYLDAMGIDMVLYGHVHSNNGSIYEPPFNLSTEGTCDGERAYRVVRVNSGTIEPQHTISAGYNGNNISNEYFPDNSGTADSVSAVINNQHPIGFQDALLKFRMPPGEMEYDVTNGEILQVYRSADLSMVYIAVDIPANDELIVSISAVPVSSENEVILEFDMQLHNYPNPFNPNTIISFIISNELNEQDELPKLVVYNLKGQKVKDLTGSLTPQPTNRYTVNWNGTDENGKSVKSGIYFYILKTETKELTKKMILLR